MERRFYERAQIGVMSNFIIKDNPFGCKEFNGVIENISEGGVLIRAEMNQFGHVVETIKAGTEIIFQTYDEYDILGHPKEDLVDGEVIVLRVEDVEDGKLLGCKFKGVTSELNEYVQNKKLSLYGRGLL